MPESLYAASCNPPRRAKRASIDPLSPQAHQLRPILPMQPYPAREVTAPAPEPDPAAAAPAAAPAKRGRKPGPLSRTAREAQRRLNHSIIEKARRTKINDALATLKQLVPPNYVPGQMMMKAKLSSGDRDRPSANDDVDVDEDDDEDDEDDEEYDGKKKKAVKANQTGKRAGKKEEKEKEFKLEILVRTVSFLQDLLEKVNHLEAEALPSATPIPHPPCTQCGAEYGTPRKPSEPSKSRKRKHFDGHSDEESYASGRQAKIPRRMDVVNDIDDVIDQSPNKPVVERHDAAPRHLSHPSSSSSTPQSSSPKEPLPPISSWLHNHSYPTTSSSTISNSMIDPQLLRPSSASNSKSNANTPTPTLMPLPPAPGSYLPSPPSSTHFDPVRSLSAGLPPVLSLGPGVSLPAGTLPHPVSVSEASSSSSGSTGSRRRTPEDESAASLLLQIASSPTFRPVPEVMSVSQADPGSGSAPSSPVFRGGAGAGAGASSGSGPFVKRNDHHRERGHERDPSLLVLSRSSSSTSSGTRTSDVRSEVVRGRMNENASASAGGPGATTTNSSSRREYEAECEDLGVGGGQRRERERNQHHQQAQTPSSLLGLNLNLNLGSGLVNAHARRC